MKRGFLSATLEAPYASALSSPAILHLCIAALMLFFLGPAYPKAETGAITESQCSSAISFYEKSLLILRISDISQSISGKVLISNAASSSCNVALQLFLSDARGQSEKINVTLSTESASIGAKESKYLQFRLSLTGTNLELPARGQMSLNDSAATARQVAIRGQDFSENSILLVLSPGVLAAFVLARALSELRFSHNVRLQDVTAMPSWDPKSSSVTTLTAIGGVLTSAIAFVALPDDTTYLNSKQSYLSLIFLMLCVSIIGPLLISLYQSISVDESNINSHLFPGLAVFFFSTYMLHWAGLTQLCVAILYVGELKLDGTMPAIAALTLQLLLTLTACALVRYTYLKSILSVRDIAVSNKSGSYSPTASRPTSSPRWPLL